MHAILLRLRISFGVMVLAFVFGAGPPPSQGDVPSRFFKLAHTSELAITSFSHDGRMTVSSQSGDAGTMATWWSVVDLASENWTTWVDMPVTAAVQTVRVANLKPPPGMALIPDGSFIMGDSFSESNLAERPAHLVYVSAFYMDRHEITRALWDEVYQWADANGYAFDNSGSGKGPEHPIHTVSWHDAVKWCNARSEKAGLTPCYYVGGNVYKTGIHDPDCDWSADGYRLPTEAEWEKAARAGAQGRRFPWRDADTISHDQANYYSWWTGEGHAHYSYDIAVTNGYHPSYQVGPPPYTSPVGSFAANDYAMYDMAGNVTEWCWDWYDHTTYSSMPRHNPRGPATGDYRVFRGGGWNNSPIFCRAADRGYAYDPTNAADSNRGFRTVRLAP